jgi:methionyl-tRNA formyltransferase
MLVETVIFPRTPALRQNKGEQVSHAAKLSKEESVLDFRDAALTLHNKVRTSPLLVPISLKKSL